MKRYRITLTIEVDDIALAKHDGKRVAPPNNIEDWNGSDLFAAARAGFIDPVEVDIVDCEQEPSS